MAEPFIFVNSYRVKPGKEEEYEEAFRRVAKVVEEEEPRMLYFACYRSEDSSVWTTVQIHADADNMVYHMDLVSDHIREAAEFLDWSSMDIHIYGTPTEALLEQMRQVAGSGVAVTVSPAKVNLSRLPVPEEHGG